MRIPKHLFIILFSIVVLGAGCFAPGSKTDIVQTSYLPDHITEVFGETLPQALLEARQRGRNSVAVSDPSGNVITAIISDPTHTIITMTDPIDVEDPIEFLKGYSVDLDKAYGVQRENGIYSFNINTVRHDELATIIYETSVRIFHIPTTQQWVIDIQ
ncbi:hypothetical protein HQ524_01260 [Candidatus Uhrbacteria bacterium]|nr:hypothetical protein [Candidatus Uhrbacteria bacterium]